MKFLILNGPNLNLLGRREPEIYGKRDYAALVAFVKECCASAGAECEVFQTNHEGVLVDMIQGALETGVYRPVIAEWAEFTNILGAEMDTVIQGTKDMDTALNDAQAALEDLLG